MAYCLGQHDMNSMCFSLGVEMDDNLTDFQQQQQQQQQQAYKGFDGKFSLPPPPFLPGQHSAPRPHEGDQVVPSFQRLTVLEGHPRKDKPLPPTPVPEELMVDESADSEVEFFTSDRRRLLPRLRPKVASHGGTIWSGIRGRGLVNHAYQESPSEDGVCRASAQVSLAAGQPQRRDAERVAAVAREASRRHQPQAGCEPNPLDKPEVPPRIPIPPKTSDATTKPWSIASSCDEDKPPKIPPRVPLVPPCPPRTPSPKSLPLYVNGVMPPTQSFAPNPKYVRKAPQRRHSERALPVIQSTPCIVPIMRDGRQASATHYFLLPGRPAYMDRLERFLSEQAREGDARVCSTEWGCQNG